MDFENETLCPITAAFCIRSESVMPLKNKIFRQLSQKNENISSEN